ncbi:hypothetical protein AB7942_29480 [Neobacillus sp. BF23-41]|uniref:hypothetical protein n=1 Tax=Neobacillus sp. BF23-41 TaxID=3240280 RepID=UPI0034E4DFDA
MIFAPLNTRAVQFEQFSSKETSKQWNVVIEKSISDNSKHNPLKKDGLYNLYNIGITNIGDKNVRLTRIEAYSDVQKKENELFTFDDKKDNMLNSSSFFQQTFPLHSKSTKMKVIVTWTDNNKSNQQRKYKEEFIFQR